MCEKDQESRSGHGRVRYFREDGLTERRRVIRPHWPPPQVTQRRRNQEGVISRSACQAGWQGEPARARRRGRNHSRCRKNGVCRPGETSRSGCARQIKQGCLGRSLTYALRSGAGHPRFGWRYRSVAPRRLVGLILEKNGNLTCINHLRDSSVLVESGDLGAGEGAQDLLGLSCRRVEGDECDAD